MFERFTKDARAVVLEARREALSAGEDAIEAEHLLLALAARPEFEEFGLDRDRLVEALAEEERRSLASVGVELDMLDPPRPTSARREPHFATSSKLALQRAVAGVARHGERRLESRHVLVGVLSAEHGRAVRALRLAEVDVERLRALAATPARDE